MQFPTITALYAGLFGLLFVMLSFWVAMGRMGMKVLHGDGGNPLLNRRIRSHGNFSEYVPFALLLTALVEGTGTGPVTIHLLLLPLLVARLLHPFGMLAPTRSMRQYTLRAGPILVTWLVIAAVSLILIADALQRIS